MSSGKAWKRTCEKHSPSKKIFISPIKPICYHSVVNSTFKERYTEALLWTLLNTEEFHYQDSCALVYHNFHSKRHLLKVLRDTRILINWKDRMEDIVKIGEGSFGEVFKGQDNITGESYALKQIKLGKRNVNENAEDFIKDILLEKSTLSEINKCPFFVRLLGAFQDPQQSSYWFVMEFCISDLTRFLSEYPSYDINSELWFDYMNENALEIVDLYMSDIYQINYKETVFIYLFEMLCGLFYLAHRHIIHADLKTDNILISAKGHIKIADLGVAFRDNWFYRRSITIIAKSQEDVDHIDLLDNSFEFRGNILHYDPEVTINYFKNQSVEEEDALDEYYLTNESYQKTENFDQSFLSDLYAVGLITIELLFGGLHLGHNPNYDESGKKQFWKIDLVYDKEINKKFIIDRFLNEDIDEDTRSVMVFLISIFKPRKSRARHYVAKKTIFVGSELSKEKYINISKVEKIQFYLQNSINQMNVLNKRFPNYFLNKLSLKSELVSSEENNLPKREVRKVFNLTGFGFTNTKYFSN